jgi:hypothetical protein
MLRSTELGYLIRELAIGGAGDTPTTGVFVLTDMGIIKG